MNSDKSILQTTNFYIFVSNDHIFVEPKNPDYQISLVDVAREIERCIIQMENDRPMLEEEK